MNRPDDISYSEQIILPRNAHNLFEGRPAMPDINATVHPSTAPKTVAAPDMEPASDSLDRLLHNWQSQFTGGRSPSTVALAMLDWAAHAANEPFRTASLGKTAFVQWQRLAAAMLGGPAAIAPQAGDHRFSNVAWQKHPYNLLVQSVLLGEEWWSSVVRSPGGVNPRNARMVAFTVRQWLDMISPSNVPWLNPEVIDATRSTNGRNLMAGMVNFLKDKQAGEGAAAPKDFVLGTDLAATPGKVVFRNALIELIQYAPATAKVGAEPVLIVPAWIMKYYILDLSPGNSMVRWLVGQGHTVFMISWVNPGPNLHDTSLDDYRSEGVMAAIDAVQSICGHRQIHGVGYCLGGTLLSITAATMARDEDHRLASLTLFAAQTDFSEAGELQLFITEDQLNFLNDIMQTQGYLSTAQMGGAFQMLQSNDLIWSHAIRHYLLGERDTPFDLMAWDADGTRLPARMHIEYLRRLYLHNDLAEGRFEVGGRPLAMDDIKLPIFLVSTEQDHIAPWHSVFKLHLQNDGAITFVLTSGGHNAGIVSEPGHKNRHFRIHTRAAGARTRGPDEWERDTPPQDGSWWPEWAGFLKQHSTKTIAAPAIGDAKYPVLCDAPGTFVREA
jgi:polyhydroxyalkanoate synthase